MKKAGVFVSAGLGDAVLLIPLVKKLKEKGYQVSGLFTSPFQCEGLFSNSRLFDRKIILTGNKIKQALLSLAYFRNFNVVYMNTFASTRKNMMLAGIMSKKIISNRIPIKLSSSLRNKIEYISPIKNIHDAAQNLRLVNPDSSDSDLNEELISFDFSNGKIIPGSVAVQISSGNNLQSFKNWPAAHWMQWLQIASENFPQLRFILIGEPKEKALADQIMQQAIPRVESRVGNTSVSQLVETIGTCKLFIGTDGGIMHIAAASKKPTFTLWGPSDFNLYGYQKMNPVKHHIFYNDMECRPCSSWIAPNTSRVSDPVLCPDKKCMRDLQADTVFNAFRNFVNANEHAE